MTRRIAFKDDGGTPMWRARHAGPLKRWWIHSSPGRIFLDIFGAAFVFFLTLAAIGLAALYGLSLVR